MKKSELRKMIREGIKGVLTEQDLSRNMMVDAIADLHDTIV